MCITIITIIIIIIIKPTLAVCFFRGSFGRPFSVLFYFSVPFTARPHCASHLRALSRRMKIRSYGLHYQVGHSF